RGPRQAGGAQGQPAAAEGQGRAQGAGRAAGRARGRLRPGGPDHREQRRSAPAYGRGHIDGAEGPVGAAAMKSVRVGLGERSYDVLVGQGLIGRAGELMRPFLARGRTAVVTDETVERLHGAALNAAL